MEKREGPFYTHKSPSQTYTNTMFGLPLRKQKNKFFWVSPIFIVWLVNSEGIEKIQNFPHVTKIVPLKIDDILIES